MGRYEKGKWYGGTSDSAKGVPFSEGEVGKGGDLDLAKSNFYKALSFSSPVSLSKNRLVTPTDS